MTSRKLPPLKRLGAGRYQTRDGRYTLMRDPAGHRSNVGGYESWLVFDNKADPELTDADCAIFLDGTVHHPTLREAHARLLWGAHDE